MRYLPAEAWGRRCMGSITQVQHLSFSNFLPQAQVQLYLASFAWNDSPPPPPSPSGIRDGVGISGTSGADQRARRGFPLLPPPFFRPHFLPLRLLECFPFFPPSTTIWDYTPPLPACPNLLEPPSCGPLPPNKTCQMVCKTRRRRKRFKSYSAARARHALFAQRQSCLT